MVKDAWVPLQGKKHARFGVRSPLRGGTERLPCEWSQIIVVDGVQHESTGVRECVTDVVTTLCTGHVLRNCGVGPERVPCEIAFGRRSPWLTNKETPG